MIRAPRFPLLLLFAAVLPAVSPGVRAAPAAAPVRVQVGTDFRYAGHVVADLDGDGASEVVIAGAGGEVEVRSGARLERRGRILLPHPERSLLAVGDILGEGKGAQLVVLSPAGLAAHRFLPGRGLSPEGTRVSLRARFQLRIGAPRFAPILRDVSGDGRPDLLLPGLRTFEIWVSGNGEGAGLTRSAVVRTKARTSRETGGDRLSDTLSSAFRIPRLSFRDVNGDGRDDLLVTEGDRLGFHLQRAGGTIPAEADRVLDLSIFRDTTPEAGIRPGKTLAGKGDAVLLIRDLDADGIPDYVIHHRRKIWIFRGTRDGPRFTDPASILKVAEDVTMLLVTRIDGDDRPDLLLLRLQVPTIAGLVAGLHRELDLTFAASGYAGEGDCTFSTTPRWRGGIRVRLPKIMDVLRNPDALLRRFEETVAHFRPFAEGDFDGDGREDVVMLGKDGRRLGWWRGAGGRLRRAAGPDIGSLFFGKDDEVWTVERILGWLRGLAEDRAAGATRGRDPDASVVLEGRDGLELVSLEAADFTGDGRPKVLVLRKDERGGGRAVLDLAGLPRPGSGR